ILLRKVLKSKPERERAFPSWPRTSWCRSESGSSDQELSACASLTAFLYASRSRRDCSQHFSAGASTCLRVAVPECRGMSWGLPVLFFVAISDPIHYSCRLHRDSSQIGRAHV